MITQMQMYWLTRLDALDALVCCIGVTFFVLSLVLGIIGMVIRVDYSYEERRYGTGKRLHHKWMPLCIAVSFVSALTASLIPSTKEMAAIIVIPKIANSEKVQDVGNRLYDLAVEWAEELRPKKKEGKEAGNAVR